MNCVTGARAFSLCQFKPEHELNPETLARYQKNRLPGSAGTGVQSVGNGRSFG